MDIDTIIYIIIAAILVVFGALRNGRNSVPTIKPSDEEEKKNYSLGDFTTILSTTEGATKHFAKEKEPICDEKEKEEEIVDELDESETEENHTEEVKEKEPVKKRNSDFNLSEAIVYESILKRKNFDKH